MEDRNSLEAKSRGHEFDEALADTCDPHPARRFALDGGHRPGISIAAHVAEVFEIGIGVDDQSEASDVVANGHADMSQSPAVNAHPGVVAIDLSRELKVAE